MEKRSERFVSIGMIVNLPIAQQQLRPSVMVGSIRGTESYLSIDSYLKHRVCSSPVVRVRLEV